MADAAADGTRVWVGNLDFSTTADGLRAFFADVGDIADVELNSQRKDPSRNKGFGYVTFNSAASADRAVAAKNETDLNGRTVRVEKQKPKAPRSSPKARAEPAEAGPSNRMYVGNVPFDSTDDDVAALFSGTAGFVKAEVATQRGGRSKGMAYVTYDTPEAVEAAIAAVGTVRLGDRDLNLDVARPKGGRGRGGAAAGAGAGAGGAEGAAGGRRRRAPRDDSGVTVVSDPSRLFVGNLPYSAGDAELSAVFAGVAGFKSAEVMMTVDGTKSRGYGYANFESPDAAAAAQGAADGQDVGGRAIKVEVERRKVRNEA